MKKFLNKKVAALFGVSLVAFQPAFAQSAYDGIVGAVDWTAVVTGITSIAALIAAVLVVSRGSKMLLRMIGR